MAAENIIASVNLFFVGLLAGEEFVIRYGVRAPMASLEAEPHIRLRQALIRTLRILVPAIFGASILTASAVALMGGSHLVLGFRLAGLLFLCTFISIALGDTVPLNQAVLTWEAKSPPENWQALIDRWERLDTLRCWAAITAFIFFLTAMALQ
jgi:uncharacterized membrane protein